MFIIIVVATCWHVVGAIYWAGSTMTMACADAPPSRRFFIAQMLVALTTVLAGGVLWCRLHAGVFAAMEQALALAAGCAVLALLVQLALVGPAVLRRRPAPTDGAARADHVAITYRISAGLLLCAGAVMSIAKYAGSLFG